MKRLAIPLLLLPLAAAAETTPRGLVVNDLTLVPPAGWYAGSLLIRAEIHNPTASDQRVRIQYNNGSPTSWAPLGKAFADLTVPAGGRSLCEIPLPRAAPSGASCLYAIDGSGKTVTVTSHIQGYGHWNHHDLFYASRSLSGETIRKQLGECAASLEMAGRYKTSYHRDSFECSVARAGDFAEPWPGDWRAYSVFSAVFVAERDLPDLPAAARAALRDYAAAGGCVFFVGAEDVPAEFADAPFAALPRTKADAGPPPVPARRCGLGLFAALPASVGAPGSDETPSDDLGAFVLRHAIRAGLVLANAQEMSDLLAAGKGATPAGAGPARPPVGTFLLLLAAFSILAGPVALRVLARRNRRIHILWVLPAFSAVFSAAIVLSLVLREGVSPMLHVRCGVLLDQRAGRAVSFATDGFYPPLSLAAVDLPADAAVSFGQRGGMSGDLSVGRTARYEGWLRPRMAGSFNLCAVRATPLRLDVREDPATGGVQAVNAFGAPVEKLWLRDAAGTLRAAKDLAPGATADLAPAAPDEAFEDLDAAKGLASHLSTALGFVGELPLDADGLVRAAAPDRRFYVAVLSGERSPFEPDPLPGRRARRTARTIGYGVY